MSKDPYAAQHRGDHGAYDRYLESMDASMRQKIALTAAHLLGQGTIADMGMGSGTGSEALAALYPALQVVGVDINETMVERASERFDRDNLRFITGDIATRCFEPGALDGIFNSSVLHHVTSFSNYDREAAGRALAAQVEQLDRDGVLIVRDFLAPEEGDQSVWLDLPDDDGSGEDPRSCSTAALLERFAREFRILHSAPGFELASRDDADVPTGWRRFVLSLRMAVEFVLRKDYRQDWETEVQEEYCTFTQAEFERRFASLGLRCLASTPIRNPWIVAHRFEGRFALRDERGRALEWPATNYVIVGERVPPGQGVRFEAKDDPELLGFLSIEHVRDLRDGRIMDLVRRPHLTVDVLPWFERAGDIFVLARKSYPRPIVGYKPAGNRPIDEASPATYVTEPLNVLQDDEPLGRTVERALWERAGVKEEDILGFAEGGHYYPSPGGIEEEVRSLLVRTRPLLVRKDIEALSGFSTSGQVRAIEARQVLRAAQVSGLPSNRLEVNVYELLLSRGVSPGAWIGAEIELAEGSAPAAVSFAELRARPPRRRFVKSGAEGSRFLELRCVSFSERDAAGQEVARKRLELVLPRDLSDNTMACALLRRSGGEVFLGLDDDDLPAAQGFTGNSNILVAPAWRLPRGITSLSPARRWVRERLEREYGLSLGRTWELGGHYHPSPGVTPEMVFPQAVEVLDESDAGRPLTWVRLDEAVAERAALPDGHLMTVMLRAAHALGRLGGSA